MKEFWRNMPVDNKKEELDWSKVSTEKLSIAIDASTRVKCYGIGCILCPLSWHNNSSKFACFERNTDLEIKEMIKSEYVKRTSKTIETQKELKSDITTSGNGWEKETHKNGVVKTMFQLFDPHFYEGVSKILTLGAQKYKPNNWINGNREEYSRAVESHWNEYKKGNKIDDESGMSHLYHVACNLMFIDYFDRNEITISGPVDLVDIVEIEELLDKKSKTYMKG